MKKITKYIFAAFIAASPAFFSGCFAGYIESEPAYVEYSRPVRPSATYIWIDGDYSWNIQKHVYVQQKGYWQKPRNGQSYVSGQWYSTPKGKSWNKGHWQKDNNRKSNRR